MKIFKTNHNYNRQEKMSSLFLKPITTNLSAFKVILGIFATFLITDFYCENKILRNAPQAQDGLLY